MKAQKPRQNSACLARQRQHVIVLGDDVLSSARTHETDEYAFRPERSRDPWECEQDGRRLACIGAHGTRVARALGCLAGLDRLAERVEEGTCGFSDASARQNPQEQLEMMQEATYTFDEEEEVFESIDPPGRLQ
jgi:hypothetical protein